MEFTRRQQLALMGGTLAAAAIPTAITASGPVVHEVLMLNVDPENKRERQVYSPPVVRANVGDTIKFIATDRGHNAQSEEDWSPAGGTEWKGRINEELEVVMEVEGAYGYKCQPHASAGMVGLILVGDVSGNYEELKGQRFRGKAKARFEAYFKIADEILASES